MDVNQWISFWGILIAVAVGGFAVLALFVAVGGFRDVKTMLSRIEAEDDTSLP